MSFEMLVLGLVTLFLMFAWLPGSAAKYRAYGLDWLLSDRSMEGLEALPEWGQRSVRAYANLRENYPAFAVAVLLLAFSGGFTPGTALASAMFLVARLVHMPACIAAIPWLRNLAWIAGFLATLYLLFMAMVALVSY
ncbi:MAG: MAPEG family protein [Gammaproteobacteria bacterium]